MTFGQLKPGKWFRYGTRKEECMKIEPAFNGAKEFIIAVRKDGSHVDDWILKNYTPVEVWDEELQQYIGGQL